MATGTLVLLAVGMLCGVLARSEVINAAWTEPAPVVQDPSATQVAPLAATDPPQLLATKHLPNAVQVHPRVISGGLPEGDAAFAELADLKIKTIISVDGAKPDAELAAKYGIRYVHLPHGYDGISAQRLAELAKGVRDLEGPIYIHCHHGKHRSPAAAGAACVAAGLIDREQANQLLKVAGTGENYRGLHRVVAQQALISRETLDTLRVDYQPSMPIPPMAEAMVELEETFDHLKRVAKAGWVAVPEPQPFEPAANLLHIDPVHQATLLQEHFKELMRTPESLGKGNEFGGILASSEAAAAQILEAMTRGAAEAESERLNKALDVIGNDCKTCHQKFRDNLPPLP